MVNISKKQVKSKKISNKIYKKPKLTKFDQLTKVIAITPS